MRDDAWHAPQTPVQPCPRPGATLAVDFCAGHAPNFALGCESGDVVLCDASRPDLAPSHIAALDTAAWDLVWAPCDASLAVACGDGSVRLYSPNTFVHTHTLGHADVPVRAVRFLQPGVIASAGRDGAIRMWDLRTSSPRAIAEIVDAHASPVPSAPATPKRRTSGVPVPASVGSLAVIDSQTIASVGQPGLSIRLWDVRVLGTAQHAKRGGARPVREISPSTAPGLRPRAFLSLAVSPDRSVLYAPSADNTVYAYATAGNSSMPLASYSAPGFRTAGSFYTRCAPSPCGRYLACGSAESTAYVFDLCVSPCRAFAGHRSPYIPPLATQAYTLGEHRHETTCVAWSRVVDGPEYIVVGGEDYVVRTWSSDRFSRALRYDADTFCIPSATPHVARPCDRNPKSGAVATAPETLAPWPSAASYRISLDSSLAIPCDNPVRLSSPVRTPLGHVCENSAPSTPCTPTGRKRQLALDAFFNVPSPRGSPSVP